MQPKISHPAENDSIFSLKRIVFVLFKRKWTILTVFCSLVLLVTVSTFLMTPLYRATAKVLVERDHDNNLAILFKTYIPYVQPQFDWINAEIEILKSYPVAAAVIKDLGLDKSMGNPEAPRTDSTPSLAERVEEFQEELSISRDANSNLIRISYDSPDPALAVTIVTHLIKIYQEYRSELYDQSDTYKFFERQLAITEEKLRDLEDKEISFKSEQEIAAPQAELNILLTKLADYERNLTAVRAKRLSKQAKMSVIRQQVQKGEHLSIPATEVSDSPSREKYIAHLREQLLNMELQREDLLQRFKPTYSEIVDLENNIATTRRKIYEEIQQIIEQEETTIQALRTEESHLENSIQAVKQEILQLTRDDHILNQLSRGIDENREVYSMLLKQREEARMALAKSQRDVSIRVVSPAIASHKPVKPGKVLNILLGIILGSLAGMGLAFFLELIDRSINNGDELVRLTGLKDLGSVRNMPAPPPIAKAVRKRKTYVWKNH